VHIYIKELKKFANVYADPTISVYFPTKISTKFVILEEDIVKLVGFYMMFCKTKYMWWVSHYSIYNFINFVIYAMNEVKSSK